MDVLSYNRQAWDRQVSDGNRWTLPVSPEIIAAARQGHWEILLTPTRPVPRAWFPTLQPCDILCLASGGGQQGPILAAAGGRVTVFDNSLRQLENDCLVAEREGLSLTTVQGDMADLSAFSDHSFDLIFHPISNVFVPDVRPVWKEAYRVLRPGGILLAGFMNPVHYIFDWEVLEQDKHLEVRYRIPYSDLSSLDEDRLRRYLESGFPLEFGHTLEDQIDGQLAAGFVLTGLYEDRDPEELINQYIATYIATRALKPA